MRYARYNNEEYQVDDDTLTVEQVRASFQRIFPELDKATAEVNGDYIDFRIQAADKGV